MAVASAPGAAILDETLDRLVYFATLAPSPHNVQGWRFRWDGAAFEVRRDPERAVLHELDPGENEGLVGFGAAVENLCIAARREGFRPEVAWLPRPQDPDLLARVVLEPGGPGADPLFPMLAVRAVNRSPYGPRPVPASLVDELIATAAAEGLHLHIATGVAQIGALAELAGRAARLKFRHAATHHELYQWLRFSAADAARTRDGLPLDQFLVPALLGAPARVAMHPAVTGRLDRVGYARALAWANETALIRSAPAVCVLTAERGDRGDYLRGGRVFERIGLRAAADGFFLQPHSAVTELGFARRAGYHASIPDRWRREIDAHPEALRAIFGFTGDPHVIAIFRLGMPTRFPERRSLRRPVDEVFERPARAVPVPGAPAGADSFYAELVSRNTPVVTGADQARLRRTRVLVAGCGSIGGAPVEVLARAGAERLLLADPGAYELNNLNRQSATLADLGRNKAEVLRERVRAINPHALVLVAPGGVSEDDLHYLVGSCALVIDGVDVTELEALRLKRLLHEEAWRQRRPVISGYDVGGSQVLRIYDYRRDGLAPLAGRIDGASGAAPLSFLSRVLAPLDFPLEILPVVEQRIRGGQDPLPQLGPTALLFGVLAAWAAVDLMAGRPVRSRARVDIPGVLRPRAASLRAAGARAVEIARLKLLFERTRRRGPQP